MRAYLSGGMEYADGEGVNWRKDMQEWLETTLDHSVFNPNIECEIFLKTKYPDFDFRTLKNIDIIKYVDIVSQLVDLDCNEVANYSDYVVCYWDEGAAKGAGTKGEITLASYFNKPVYLVSLIPPKDIPGWVLGCTTKVFDNFTDLKIFLIKTYSS